MDSFECGNRIGGQARPALSGGTFERRTRSFPWVALQRWPRSGPKDVELALGTARTVQESWGNLGRAGRLERLLGAPRELERRDATGVLAAGLGLGADEFRPRQNEELFRFGETLEILREGPETGPEPGAPGAFVAHWSDFSAGLGMRLAGRLLAGDTAVLWSDPGLPEAAALLVESLEAAGLPPGVLGLLHDDLRGSLRWGLREGAWDWVRLKGHDKAIAGWAGKEAGRVDPSPWPLRNTSEVVLEGEDPALRAREVALKALGRSDTLSGQLPGQVGRVICHQRLFSRFSEEFLHDLEAAPDLLVPAIDGDLPEYVRRAWALGLDEGATPIHGGQPLVKAAGPPPGRALGSGETAGRPPLVVPPVVFTNVEPRQRLARLRRPAPMVVLVRAPSDGAARELAAALDSAAGPASQEQRQET